MTDPDFTPPPRRASNVVSFRFDPELNAKVEAKLRQLREQYGEHVTVSDLVRAAVKAYCKG